MATKPGVIDGVEADPAWRRVIAAENTVSASWQRLNAARRAAFFGGDYDAGERRRAECAYRAAERALRDARAQLARRRALPPGEAPAEAPAA